MQLTVIYVFVLLLAFALVSVTDFQVVNTAYAWYQPATRTLIALLLCLIIFA